MKFGKLNISLSFYAALAFILAFMGQTLLCVILLLFAIFVEKDRWLNKQLIQALLLCISKDLLLRFISFWTDFVHKIIEDLSHGNVDYYVFLAVKIAFLVIAVLSVIKVSNDKDANLPILGNIANNACSSIDNMGL